MSAVARSTVWVCPSLKDEVNWSEPELVAPLPPPQAISTREAGMARRMPPTRMMTSRRFMESMLGGPGTPRTLRLHPPSASLGLRKDSAPWRLPDLVGQGCSPDGVCLDLRGV